jgi:succinate dehydrogenase / fumarate reductase flavoprotein subunit
MWEYCGMARNDAGLTEALYQITELRHEFARGVRIPGGLDEYNPEMEKACRVADFIELGQLMVRDAQQRKESCGGHFREEYQTSEGEALRNDEKFAFVGAWEYKGRDASAELHREALQFNEIKLSQRSYK